MRLSIINYAAIMVVSLAKPLAANSWASHSAACLIWLPPTEMALLMIPTLLDCCSSSVLSQMLTIEHHLLSQILHIAASVDVLTGIEVACGGVQQVCDHLIVYLHEAATQADMQVLTPLHMCKAYIDLAGKSSLCDCQQQTNAVIRWGPTASARADTLADKGTASELSTPPPHPPRKILCSSVRQAPHSSSEEG